MSSVKELGALVAKVQKAQGISQLELSQAADVGRRFVVELSERTTVFFENLLPPDSGERLRELSEEVGMRPGLVLGRLDAMVKRIRPAARELASEMESTGPCPVYAKIIAVIEKQVESVGATP